MFVETSGCWIIGDPHITTYDGAHLAVQSDCLYVAVHNNNPTENVPAFTVLTKFEHRNGVTAVSYPSYLQLFVYNTEFILDRHNVVMVVDIYSLFMHFYQILF